MNHPLTYQDVPLRDPLTGAYSRAFMNACLQEEIEKARRYGENFTLLLLDLDHFKSVNDAFGHIRGDQVLIEFAQRLHKLIRSSDLVFRYGGDEFVLLLCQTKRPQALIVAQRLLGNLRTTPFSGDPPLALTLSSGVASFPDDGQSAETLFEVADRRHYWAKHAGRNCIVSEDLWQANDVPLPVPLRPIEREQALETAYRFLEALPAHRRGILQVKGLAGAGRSRLLKEIRRVARLHGYAVLDVRGTPALRTRQYGVLAQARRRWEVDTLQKKAPLEVALSQSLTNKELAGLVVTLDNLPDVDQASLDLLRDLFLSAEFPTFALVYAAGETGSNEKLCLNAQLEKKAALAPLSLAGLQIWVRHSLRWEAPPDLLAWLHRETGGLPGYIQRGLSYLVEHELLRPTVKGWSYAQDLTRLPLAEWLTQRPDSPPHNLPEMLPALVGREEEIHALKKLLQERRLITLVGPGGSGKTRLAIQVAAESRPSFSDGVFFVPLASLRSTDLLAACIVDVLGLSLSTRCTPRIQLTDYVRAKKMLLVLDNFGRLPGGVEFLNEILIQAPQVKLLVTSQEQLDLPDKAHFEIKGLPFPTIETNQDLKNYDAVQLFLTHAQRAHPGFSLCEENETAVMRICRLMEGIPLGIELAAAWIQTLSCQEIASQIEHNLARLIADGSGLPECHQSTYAVVDALWGLFSQTEQAVLRKLSVFRGGFSGEAARQVAGASPFFLDALVAKVFLRTTPSGRYQIHSLLRQYATARLQALPEEQIQARNRHSAYYATFLQRHKASLKLGKRQALEATSIEAENLCAAWNWAVKQAQIQVLSQSYEALSCFYRLVGLFQKGEVAFGVAAYRVRALVEGAAQSSWETQILLGGLLVEWASCLELQGQYEQALAAIQETIDLTRANEATELEALGRLQWGHILWHQGVYAAARRQFEQALALSRQAHSRKLEADSLRGLSNIYLYQSDYSKAREYLEPSLAICRAIDHRWGEATALNNFGVIHWYLSDYATARDYYEQALRVRQEIGDRQGEAVTAHNLGEVLGNLSDYAGARAWGQHALNIYREIGDRQGEGNALNSLAELAVRLGEYALAREQLEQALHICLEIGEQRGEAKTLVDLGELFHYLGEDRTACECSRRGLQIGRSLNDRHQQSVALTTLGRALAGLGHWTEAARVYRQALTLRQELGQPNLALESLAGLAQVSLARGALRQAQAQVEEMLELFKSNTLDGTRDPFWVYLTCYQVLQIGQDSRAQVVLDTAYHLLQEQSAKITDEKLQRAFLDNIAAHREIVREWRNNRGDQG